MNDEETPLAQFQTWYGSRARAGLDGQSEYVKFREAFFAGFAARPRPPIEPSRHALESKSETIARYAPPQPMRMVERRPPLDWTYDENSARFVPGTEPDYIQHGTITGRLPRRDVDYADKSQRFQEVYGVTPDKVSGADRETLERVSEQLRRDGQVEYPVSDDTNPGFPAVTRADTALMGALDVPEPARSPRREPEVGLEHTETVWGGDGRQDDEKFERFQQAWGAPGPVPTPLSIQEDENGGS